MINEICCHFILLLRTPFDNILIHPTWYPIYINQNLGLPGSTLRMTSYLSGQPSSSFSPQQMYQTGTAAPASYPATYPTAYPEYSYNNSSYTNQYQAPQQHSHPHSSYRIFDPSRDDYKAPERKSDDKNFWRSFLAFAGLCLILLYLGCANRTSRPRTFRIVRRFY